MRLVQNHSPEQQDAVETHWLTGQPRVTEEERKLIFKEPPVDRWAPLKLAARKAHQRVLTDHLLHSLLTLVAAAIWIYLLISFGPAVVEAGAPPLLAALVGFVVGVGLLLAAYSFVLADGFRDPVPSLLLAFGAFVGILPLAYGLAVLSSLV